MSLRNTYKAVERICKDATFRHLFFKEPKKAMSTLGLTRPERVMLASLCPSDTHLLQTGIDMRINPAVALWYGDILGNSGASIPYVGYTRLGVHRLLLADRARTESFGRAIAAVVRPDQTVLDVGTGSGILAFLACRAGAARVYAVEKERIIHLTAKNARRNSMTSRIVFIEGNIDNPEIGIPVVDTIMSECIGSFGVNTQMIESVLRARQRFLAPDGNIIPRSMSLRLCPVESLVCDWQVRFWSQRQYGFKFDAASVSALNQMYTVVLSPRELLAEPQEIKAIDFWRSGTTDFSTHTNFHVLRDGYFHGFGGWFELELAPGMALSTAPGAALTSWYHVFLPVSTPSLCRKGDVIDVRISKKVTGNAFRWRWSTKCACKDGVRTSFQDTLRSYPSSSLAEPLG